MKEARIALRNNRRIWCLTASAVAWTGLSIFIAIQAMHSLHQELASQNTIQAAYERLEEQYFAFQQQANHDCLEVLDSPRDPKSRPKWLVSDPFANTLLEVPRVGSESELASSLRSIREEFQSLYAKAEVWANEWLQHETQFSQCNKSTQLEIQQWLVILQQASETGKEDLEEELPFWNALRCEATNLLIHATKIQNIDNPDKLDGYRENHLGPTLSRIRSLLAENRSRLAATPELKNQVERIEQALFGVEHDSDSGHYLFAFPEKSLLDLIATRQRLKRENRELASLLVTSHGLVHDRVHSLRAQNAAMRRASQARSLVMINKAWNRIRMIGCIGLGVLIVLSIGLPREIKKQWKTLQSAFDSLRQQKRLLQSQEERFAYATDQAHLGVLLIQVEDQRVWLNDGAQAMLGENAETVENFLSRWRDCVHSEDWEKFHESLDRILRGIADEWRTTFRTSTPEGEVRWLQAIGTISERDKHGRPLTISGILIDETERFELENQLARSHRLESIGLLAAGVAHEINTPTQYVHHHLAFLEQAFVDLTDFASTVATTDAIENEEVKAAAEKADLSYLLTEVPKSTKQSLEGLDRIAKIVKSLKELSHPSQELACVEVGALLRSAVDLSRCEWRHHAEVEMNVPKNPIWIEAVPGEISQILLNLIVNASHAIEEEKRTSPDRRGKISLSVEEQEDGIDLTVSDNGCGMSESTQRKMFDPFFTTKAIGKGTGQGLSIVNRIIQQYDGSVTVQSQVGQGTTIVIRLPKCTTRTRIETEAMIG